MMLGSRPTTRTTTRQHAALWLLPLLSLALAIWGCGGGFRMGASTLKVADVPLAELRMDIQITGQFSGRPDVMMLPSFFEGPSQQDQVALPPGAHVTCNGSDITPVGTTRAQVGFKCPRQPPGGSYRIAYSDTHGASTAVLLPVPSGGSFELLSPATEAKVRIPANGQLEIRYAAPIPPPHGTLTLENVSAWCQVEQQGCAVSAFPPVSDPSSSGDSVGNAARRPAVAANPLATSTPPPASTPQQAATPTALPGATAAPGDTPTAPPIPAQGNASATVTVYGGVGTIHLRGDFSQFLTGPGTIVLGVEGQETLDHAGFAAAAASFVLEFRTTTIIWTR